MIPVGVLVGQEFSHVTRYFCHFRCEAIEVFMSRFAIVL